MNHLKAARAELCIYLSVSFLCFTRHSPVRARYARGNVSFFGAFFLNIFFYISLNVIKLRDAVRIIATAMKTRLFDMTMRSRDDRSASRERDNNYTLLDFRECRLNISFLRLDPTNRRTFITHCAYIIIILLCIFLKMS